MIELLRSAASSLVAKLLLGLLVLSFAAWGIGDVLRGASGSDVAEVGGRSISIQDYSRAFSDAMRSVGDMNLQQARALNLDQIVLGGLINKTVLSEEADSLGVGAPDEAVVSELREAPAFQNAGGAFQKEIYEMWLQNRGRRKRDFEAELREEIARGLLSDGVRKGGALSRAVAELIWKRRNEQRDLDFISLDLAAAPPPGEPTEEQIAAFHETEAERFTAPEYREIAYLWVRAADRANPAEVSESEVRTLYEERKDEFQKPERRNLEQVVFDDEAAAKAALERLDDGESFDKIAADAGYGESEAALGYKSKAEIEIFDPKLAEAAFGLRTDGVVGPVDTGSGWALVKINGVSPAEETSFEDAREELTEEVALQRARVELPAVANAVEDLRAAGETFAEIAEDEKVSVGVVTVDQNGFTPEGERARSLPPDPHLFARAFEMELGDEMDLAELPGGEYYAVEARSTTPATLKPLETVRDEVIEAWKTDQRRAALAEKTAALLERLKGGETLEAVAKELGAEVKTAEGLTRGAGHPQLPTELINAMYALEGDEAEGAAFKAPAEGGRRQVLAVVTTVTPADPADGAAEIDSMMEGVARNVSDDMLQLYTSAAIAEHGYSVNQSALEFALSRQN